MYDRGRFDFNNAASIWEERKASIQWKRLFLLEGNAYKTRSLFLTLTDDF